MRSIRRNKKLHFWRLIILLLQADRFGNKAILFTCKGNKRVKFININNTIIIIKSSINCFGQFSLSSYAAVMITIIFTVHIYLLLGGALYTGAFLNRTRLRCFCFVFQNLLLIFTYYYLLLVTFNTFHMWGKIRFHCLLLIIYLLLICGRNVWFLSMTFY